MTPEEIENLVKVQIHAELKPLEAKMDDILKLLAKFEGAGTLVKVIFYAILPLIGIGTAVKQLFDK